MNTYNVKIYIILCVLIIIFSFLPLLPSVLNAKQLPKSPSFKYGDIVKVTQPFYSNCISGQVTDMHSTMDSFEYWIEHLKCPVYNTELHRTEFSYLMMWVEEKDLKLYKGE